MSGRDNAIFLQIERECNERTERVRQMLIDSGRPDLLADMDRNLRELRLGINGARATWHSISKAQRGTLLVLQTRLYLRRASGSRTRYDAIGEPHAVRNVCGVPTLLNLAQRELVAWDGGGFDPMHKAVMTERGRFVVLQAMKDDAAERPAPSTSED